MFKRRKEEYNYFSAFEEISLLIIDAADFLSENIKDYQLQALEGKLKEIHKIEQEADEKKHHMMSYLYQDFLPPIEREDIIQLSHGMDTVLDNIEDVLIRMDMYQAKVIKPEMLEFMDIVEKASHKLSEMIKELKDFKKSKQLLSIAVEINQLEEQADVIYQKATKSLFIDQEDLFESFVYSKIYDAFEKSCDSFEDVANIVESIILKNT
ncbi:DUF47 family protein [Jeotgalibaca sp. MA1X17-3]|uniref:DUF47 domain-containing protein n=1 Tax=Jeotgalibaca sp. MA1X17-3 TaxID=2908211 RepID=UPI001F43A7C1|nr:DUF47 family protein [Jeotgalibaca sp. MA1X17-3]UJF15729.1 DUF47 family protein [Jeotgalibaca sp. MA1X17-3]